MPASIRYLILALTTRCNLQCTYCYNCGTDGNTPLDMPAETMACAIDLAGHDAPFHLQITGGEPTLCPEAVRQAARLAIRSSRCQGMAIQTNATCLTPQLAAWFKSEGFQVGVSLDGPPAIQEQQRGHAAETLRGLQLLEAAGVPFRVTTVLTRDNVRFLDRLVLTLAGFTQVRGIGLDLLIEKGRARGAGRGNHAHGAALKEGLKRMVTTLDAVNARRPIPIRLRELDLLAADRHSPGAFCQACLGRSLAVHPDGRLYPCGQTLGDPRFAAGTVWEPQLERLKAFTCFRPRNSLCATCPLDPFCPGDCPSRLHYNERQAPTRVCELYRTLWTTIRHLERTTEGGSGT